MLSGKLSQQRRGPFTSLSVHFQQGKESSQELSRGRFPERSVHGYREVGGSTGRVLLAYWRKGRGGGPSPEYFPRRCLGPGGNIRIGFVLAANLAEFLLFRIDKRKEIYYYDNSSTAMLRKEY